MTFYITRMNNTIGIVTAFLFAGLAWIDAFEQWMRIGASIVAIIAGTLMIAKYITLWGRDRKERKAK
jgi:hypothetical protein